MALSDFKSFDNIDTEFRNSKGKIKAAPELPAGVKMADTHCHLGMFSRPGFVIARAACRGFGFLCCVSDPGDEPEKDEPNWRSARTSYDELDEWLADAQSILDAWGSHATLPRIRYAVGVHPHNAKRWDKAQSELESLLLRPETCCLGEIGLDYHYDFSPRDVQREVFARQLSFACEANIPVQLHLREAHAEALDILLRQGVPQAGCILHCFNLDSATLAPFLELGCYVGFDGPLTFKKAYYTRLACLDVSPRRLLTETDAPYMAPEPLRGTVCMPDFAVYTLRCLLDCFGYHGFARANELLQPRPGDIESGASPVDTASIDFNALQKGYSETAFSQRVYDNAIELLG